MQNTRQILIIDDEDNIRLTIKAALSPMGFALHEAINGEEALATLDHSPFDLALGGGPRCLDSLKGALSSESLGY
jgi:CheY-like chemotaxis protein